MPTTTFIRAFSAAFADRAIEAFDQAGATRFRRELMRAFTRMPLDTEEVIEIVVAFIERDRRERSLRLHAPNKAVSP